MILSSFYCIVYLPLLCCKFGIAKNYALLGVNLFSLKFGWCKENDIFHVWHWTVHSAQCTVHTVNCTLHTANCTLNTAHWTLNTEHCTLYTSHYTLITAHCIPQITHWPTSSHLKSFLEPAVPPRRLFLMINMMPLKRCLVKGNYFTALLRNEARNKFLMSGPWLSVAKLRPLSFAASRWRCLYLLL